MISSILRGIVHDRFWIEWGERFKRKSHEVITPADESVIKFVEGMPVDEDETRLYNAVEAWRYVNEVIEYEFTSEWQPPSDLLERGIGDCEDYSFLMCSILPHIGYEEPTLVIGYLDFPNGESEEHVWVKADGLLIDATGTPEEIGELAYRGVEEYELQMVG